MPSKVVVIVMNRRPTFPMLFDALMNAQYELAERERLEAKKMKKRLKAKRLKAKTKRKG